MPLEPAEVNPEERKRAGRAAAIAERATQRKPTGQTSPEVYPYTYWWIVGYNEQVDEGYEGTGE